MSRSLVYAVNPNTQNVALGGIVNFGNLVRRFGCNCGISNGNLTVDGNGFYSVDSSITIEGTEAGTAIFTWYKDGAIVPGASATIVTTDGGVATVSMPTFAIRENGCCCNNSSTLTCVVTGVTVNITTASALLTKE